DVVDATSNDASPVKNQEIAMKQTTRFLSTLIAISLLSACFGANASGQESDQNNAKENQMQSAQTKLLYMGQASVRFTTPEGKVIYVDPFAGDGYQPAADLILVTHGHRDHNDLDKIENRNPGCRTITWKEALKGGEYQTFKLDYVEIEAVEAGYNKNHDVKECAGFVLTYSDGVKVYLSVDTSKTKQMPSLAEKKIDYAFYCCDGTYNMDLDEAAECAKIVGAKHNVPYHVGGKRGPTAFDRERAEKFNAPNRLIVDAGEEITLTKE
ncbi:MAG: MBL fold metallo-hydrolase, partial [Thermoguttaceae bacterium]|nr:MBL fold metallo-hydrolase [Thermoguttaceae bacterium]